MTETVILDFQIDQSQAITQLKETEKTIISLKDEQKELNQAYKEGAISQDQYIDENLKLNQQLKKETDQKKVLLKTLETESNSRNAMRSRVAQLTKEYNNLNTETAEGKQRSQQLAAELNKLNTALNKGSKDAGSFKDNIGNYSDAMAEAATSTNVAGVSIGDLGAKVASLANPITAAVGLLTALGAAYAQSSTGARDLAFAQAELGISTQLLIDDFGELISTGKEGEGLFTTIADLFSVAISGFTNTAIARYKAQQQILLKDLEISQAFAQAAAKESERQAELLRRVRDDQTKSVEERLAASEKIDQELESSAQRSIAVLEAQVKAIKEGTVNYELNRDAQLQVAQLTAEIADKEEEITGKLTENVTARQNIIAELEKEKLAQQELLRIEQQRVRTRQAVDTRIEERQDDPVSTDQIRDQVTQIREIETDAKKRLASDVKKINDKINSDEEKRVDFYVEQKQREVNAAQTAIDVVGSLFDEQSAEYKALAMTQNFIDTYRAATAALAPPPTGAGPLFGPVLAAATILAGTANASRIAGFASGGFTGSGSHKDHTGHRVAGVVHDNEYVVPKWQVTHPTYSPLVSSLEMGRLKGYADGGLVAQSITQPVNNELALSNALKNMKPVPISVLEVTRVQDRIKARERGTKI